MTGRRTIASVCDDLLGRIRSGKSPAFAPGQVIPPGRVLAADLGASLLTVQRAVQRLADDGHLVKLRKGYAVRQQPLSATRAFLRLGAGNASLARRDEAVLRGTLCYLAVRFGRDAGAGREMLDHIVQGDDRGAAYPAGQQLRMMSEALYHYENGLGVPIIQRLLQRSRAYLKMWRDVPDDDVMRRLQYDERHLAETQRFQIRQLHAMLDPQHWRDHEMVPGCGLHVAGAVGELLLETIMLNRWIEDREAGKSGESIDLLSNHRSLAPSGPWTEEQVLQRLRQWIAVERPPFARGSPMPSAAAIQEKIKASRTTIEKAVRRLVVYDWCFEQDGTVCVGPRSLVIDDDELAGIPAKTEDIPILMAFAGELSRTIYRGVFWPERASVFCGHAAARLNSIAVADQPQRLSGSQLIDSTATFFGLMARESTAPLAGEMLLHLLRFVQLRYPAEVGRLGQGHQGALSTHLFEICRRLELPRHPRDDENEGRNKRSFVLEKLGEWLINPASLSADDFPIVSHPRR